MISSPSDLILFGTVTGTKDELKMGRIEVLLNDHGTEIKVWARVVQPMASKKSGAFFLPEIDDQVVVLRGPGGVSGWMVLGCLYTGKRLPFTPEADGKNNIKQIYTRGGNQITLDDTKGTESILIETPKSKVSVLLETEGAQITVKAETKVIVQSDAVEITGDSKVTVKGPKEVKVDGGDITLSGGNIKLSGDKVEIG